MKGRVTILAVVLFCGINAHAQPKYDGVGRTATPAEIAAWDIDVRADFKGLPVGSGSVSRGMRVWEAQCESCHGAFGESNEVFGSITGGTTKQDIETGRVANLRRTDFPQRSTLMKLSQVSMLWDYINRAMPWNAPKTLTVEEVYAVTAYVLHLGDIVAADFVLSDRNIAEVQKRLPNRHGLVHYASLWNVRGKADVANTACMKDCEKTVTVSSSLPEHVRNSHGNLALQQRVVGPFRGADTTQAAAVKLPQGSARTTATATEGAMTPVELARQHACVACHATDRKMIGPSYAEVAEKYGRETTAVGTLTQKIRHGGSGVWGSVPMPPNTQLSEHDLKLLVAWVLQGGK